MSITKKEFQALSRGPEGKANVKALTQEEVSSLAQGTYNCYRTACKNFKLTALPHVVEAVVATPVVAVVETPVEEVITEVPVESAPVAKAPAKAPVAQQPARKPAPKPMNRKPAPKQHAKQGGRHQDRKRARFGPVVEAETVWDELPDHMRRELKQAKKEANMTGVQITCSAQHNGEDVVLTPTMVYRLDENNPRRYEYAMYARSTRSTWEQLKVEDMVTRVLHGKEVLVKEKVVVTDHNRISVLVPTKTCHAAAAFSLTIGILQAEYKDQGLTSQQAQQRAYEEAKDGKRLYKPAALLIRYSRESRAKIHLERQPTESEVQLRKLA